MSTPTNTAFNANSPYPTQGIVTSLIPSTAAVTSAYERSSRYGSGGGPAVHHYPTTSVPPPTAVTASITGLAAAILARASASESWAACASGSGSRGGSAIHLSDKKRKHEETDGSNDTTASHPKGICPVFSRIVEDIIVSYLGDGYDLKSIPDNLISVHDRLHHLALMKRARCEIRLMERKMEINTFLNMNLTVIGNQNVQKTIPRLNVPWFRKAFDIPKEQQGLTVESVFHGWNSKTLEQRLCMLDFFQSFYERIEVDVISEGDCNFIRENLIFKYVNFRKCLPHLWTLAENPEDLTTKPQTIDALTLTLIRNYTRLDSNYNPEEALLLTRIRRMYGPLAPLQQDHTKTAGSGGAAAQPNRDESLIASDKKIMRMFYEIYNEDADDLYQVGCRLEEYDEPYSDVVGRICNPLLSEAERQFFSKILATLKEQLSEEPGIFTYLNSPELVKLLKENAKGEKLAYAAFPGLDKALVPHQIWFLRLFYLYVDTLLSEYDSRNPEENLKILKTIETRYEQLRTNFKHLIEFASHSSPFDLDKIPMPQDVLNIMNDIKKNCVLFEPRAFDAIQSFPFITDLAIHSDCEPNDFNNVIINLRPFPQLTSLTLRDCETHTFLLENCKKLSKITIVGYYRLPLLSSLINHPIPLEIHLQHIDDQYNFFYTEELSYLVKHNSNITIVEHEEVEGSESNQEIDNSEGSESDQEIGEGEGSESDHEADESEGPESNHETNNSEGPECNQETDED